MTRTRIKPSVNDTANWFVSPNGTDFPAVNQRQLDAGMSDIRLSDGTHYWFEKDGVDPLADDVVATEGLSGIWRLNQAGVGNAGLITHEATGTEGQTEFTVPEYDKVGTLSIDGATQAPSSYIENNNTTVTLDEPLNGGELIVFSLFTNVEQFAATNAHAQNTDTQFAGGTSEAELRDHLDNHPAPNSTDELPEGSSNLYHTEQRVSANPDVSANSAARHAQNSDTKLAEGTANEVGADELRALLDTPQGNFVGFDKFEGFDFTGATPSDAAMAAALASGERSFTLRGGQTIRLANLLAIPEIDGLRIHGEPSSKIISENNVAMRPATNAVVRDWEIGGFALESESTTGTSLGMFTTVHNDVDGLRVYDIKFDCDKGSINAFKLLTENQTTNGGNDHLAKNITIERCLFNSVGRMGIEVQNHDGDTVARNKNIKIKDCLFGDMGVAGSNGMCISLSGWGDGALIDDCKFLGSYQIGTEIVGFDNTLVRRAEFGGTQSGRIVQTSGSRVARGVVFEGCYTSKGVTTTEVFLGALDAPVVKDCDFNINGQIEVAGSAGAKLINNRVISTASSAVIFDNAPNGVVLGGEYDNSANANSFSVIRFNNSGATGGLVDGALLKKGALAPNYIDNVGGAADNNVVSYYQEDYGTRVASTAGVTYTDVLTDGVTRGVLDGASLGEDLTTAESFLPVQDIVDSQIVAPRDMTDGTSNSVRNYKFNQSIELKNTSGARTVTFTPKNSRQRPLTIFGHWSGRNNNVPRGGVFTLSFGSFNDASATPIFDTLGAAPVMTQDALTNAVTLNFGTSDGTSMLLNITAVYPITGHTPDAGVNDYTISTS